MNKCCCAGLWPARLSWQYAIEGIVWWFESHCLLCIESFLKLIGLPQIWQNFLAKFPTWSAVHYITQWLGDPHSGEEGTQLTNTLIHQSKFSSIYTQRYTKYPPWPHPFQFISLNLSCMPSSCLGSRSPWHIYLHEAVRISMVVNGAPLTWIPAQYYEVVTLITSVNEISGVPKENKKHPISQKNTAAFQWITTLQEACTDFYSAI